MFPEKIHRYIFLFGIFGLGFGMMIGAVPTSVPQIILAANWMFELDFKRKRSQLKFNKVFWILSAVFLMHVVGLLYTHDLNEGLKDLKTKMPLFFLPLLFLSTKPLSLKEFYTTLYCFIAGCVTNTLWCLVYSFGLHQNEELRDASRFMNHIRLGLYLNVAIAACVYFVIKSQSFYKKTALILLAIYFVFILYILGLASGIMNFAILFLGGLCYVIYRQKASIKIVGLIVLATFVAVFGNYVYSIKETQLTLRSTENNFPQKMSPSGRSYLHYENNFQKENGYYIQRNIQPEELYTAWKKEFPVDSFNYEAKHNLQRYVVLVRYLASKGLNKDSAGMAKLSMQDKINIQKNIPNYEFPSWSYLHKRTYELVNEYDEFTNKRLVNGHSLTMRLYFWKAATHVVKNNFVFGVGTGDVQSELNKTYAETASPLDEEWYKRPHNQFLTITVALGIIGLFISLLSIFYPTLVLKNSLPKLYWPFLVIVVLSFFLEDTLETQAGCTFYAFFSSLFISVGWYRNEHGRTLEKLPG